MSAAPTTLRGDGPELVSGTVAARLLGLSKNTFWRVFAADPALRACQRALAGNVLPKFSRNALAAWVDSPRQPDAWERRLAARRTA